MSTDPVRSDHVEPERIEWLWMSRIPKGMITVVAGRPDQGKGLFAAYVTAVSSKRGINTLYSAQEDSHGLMTRPRLEAAGANLKRVHLWRFQLPVDMAKLEKQVRSKKIGLIVIDPLSAHLVGGISRHSDNIRQVLAPLTALIEETGTAVLIIEHALKRVPANGHVLNAIGGSGSGLPAAARAAYVFGVDPSDPDKRVLATAKFNIGEKPKALAFEVDTIDHEKVGTVPSLVFDEELADFDPMRLFTAPAKGSLGRPPDKKAAAAEWLTNYLAAAGKPVASGTVMEDAKQFGMSTRTLRRAADDMQVVKNPPGGGRNCTWELPKEVLDLLGMGDTPAPPIDQHDGEVDGEVDSEFEKGLADLLGGDSDADA